MKKLVIEKHNENIEKELLETRTQKEETDKRVLYSMGYGKIRYIKCPKYNQKNWNKKDYVNKADSLK